MSKVQLAYTVLVILFICGTVFAIDNANTVEVLSSNEMGNHEPYAPQFEPLVLNSLYTEWCFDIATNSKPDDALCITPRGSRAMFTTDASGNSSITLDTSTLPPDSFFEVAIAYQNSRQSIAVTMPIWFNFLPTNNEVADAESINMLAKYNDEPALTGTFQRLSLSALGWGSYTVENGNQATLELVFERLVPNAEYSLRCVVITAPSNEPISERPCN